MANIPYSIEETDSFDRIAVNNEIIFGTPGEPELPRVTLSYVTPPGQSVTGITVIDESWQEIPGYFYLYPRQRSASINDTVEFAGPDTVVYHSSAAFPNSAIAGYSSGNLRGDNIVSIVITPFRYFPNIRRLEKIVSLRVKINTGPGTMSMRPKRQSSMSASLFKKFTRAAVLNDAEIEQYHSFRIEENPDDLTPTELPSLLGPPVDLLIITSDELVLAYENFARFKKLFGFNAVIKTMTWIKEHYNGIDDAERVRNFIREAVEKWGVAYVLLGNDVPEIPTRWIWVDGLIGQRPVHTATDLYYSDLDGNWNADGDERFGEICDSIDFYPDVFVGRIPAHNYNDAISYLDKIKSYLLDRKVPPEGTPPFQSKALFVSSTFWSQDDSYYMAGRLNTHLPSHFYRLFLNEMPTQDYLMAINDGYNVINFLAHGDVNLMRVRTTPRENVTNFDYDSLTNDVYPLMVVITCYAGPFQEDCLGEHWVMNPHGGGIAFIGPTSSSSATDHEQYVTFLLDSLFHFPLAGALGHSKIPLIGASQLDNWNRVFQYSLNLLGDPAVQIWERLPQDVNSLIVSPETITVGIDTVSIALDPQVDSFIVIFHKENELFAKDTGYAGLAQTPVRTRSPGYLRYSVLCNGYVARIDSIHVAATLPYPVFHSYTLIDTAGNGNGTVNPGEDLVMDITLVNNGGSTATGVSVQVSCADSFITVINNTAAYPDLDPGDTAKNLAPFRFLATTRIPDEHAFNFDMAITCDGAVIFDTCQIIALAPRLELFTHKCDILGSMAKIAPYVMNQGHCTAESATGRISAYSDTILVLDSTVSFPVLYPNMLSPATDSYLLQLSLPGNITFNSQISNLGFMACSQQVIIRTPARPESIWTFGAPVSIILNWLQAPGAIGYRVYRKASVSEPYQFLKNSLEPIGHYEDYDVAQGVDYYYYVCTVDSFLNESSSSDTICAITNPLVAGGWPQTVYGYLFASPNFFDVDPDYPGLEVVACTKDGGVYVWHCDGTPLTGDGRIFQCDREIWSSPAIGDMNSDGTAEIVFGIRRPADNIYVLTRSDTAWVPLAGWPKDLLGGVLTSPVLSDIDEDNDLELFICSENGMLYAFHHTGEGVFSPNGILKGLYGYPQETPAIGDINNDGDLEIVACGGSETDSLFVWNRFGEYLEPFPISVMAKMSYSPVLGDVIGDERLEICFFTDSLEFVHVVDATGNILWQNFILALGDVEASPILANITGNERPEIICGNNQGFDVLLAYDSLGMQIPGFPPGFGYDYKLPIVADADGDANPDIICGSADWNLYAIGDHGQLVTGFPIHFGIRIEMSPAVYDIDQDGKLELMVGAHDFKFWVFDLNSEIYEWPKFRYDQYNTGVYHSPNLGINERLLARDGKQKPDFRVFPNPFYGSIRIAYIVDPKSTDISLKVYDACGRLVRNLLRSTTYSTTQYGGLRTTNLVWQGTDDLGRKVPAGVYFVRLDGGSFKQAEKVVLLK